MDKDAYDYNTIDLGGYTSGYADTYDINDTMNSIGTITISGGGASGTSMSTTSSNVYIGGGTGYTLATGANGTGYGNLTYSTPFISTTTSSSGLQVKGDADFEGDLKVKGKSLNDWMETMEKRLAILVPDPKKLEKFEALQKAYKHYKMLEALCEIEDDNTEN